MHQIVLRCFNQTAVFAVVCRAAGGVALLCGLADSAIANLTTESPPQNFTLQDLAALKPDFGLPYRVSLEAVGPGSAPISAPILPQAQSLAAGRRDSTVLGQPLVRVQGVYRREGSDDGTRIRIEGLYPPSRDLMFGVVLDWTEGKGFADTAGGGVNLSELYVTASPSGLPGLRLVAGLMDLTSYFDRNSFAKDGASQFFNLAFQTNPALSAAGLSSRVGLLANWSLTDDVDAKAVVFSARRNLGDLALDSVAAEVGLRFGLGTFGSGILRGTYVSSEDAGRQTTFPELFQINRGGSFGVLPGDREKSYGINSEFFIPKIKLGLFGRYGRYDDTTVGRGADTYSFGLTLLDVFADRDRLGLAYGRQLSNADLRRSVSNTTLDVLELYYDFRLSPNLRGAVMLQERNEFSETVAGFRIKTEFDVSRWFR